MNSKKFVGLLNEPSKEIQELQAKKSEIVVQIKDLESQQLKKVYGQVTISELREIWNNADHMQRFHILDSNPEVEQHVSKLESYGGLRECEMIQEIIEAKWDKCEWLEEMDSYFESYCKEEESS